MIRFFTKLGMKFKGHGALEAKVVSEKSMLVGELRLVDYKIREKLKVLTEYLDSAMLQKRVNGLNFDLSK